MAPKGFIKVENQYGLTGYVTDEQWEKIEYAQTKIDQPYELNLRLGTYIDSYGDGEHATGYLRLIITSLKNTFKKI